MKQFRLLLATLLAFVYTTGAWANHTSGYLTFNSGILIQIADGAEDVVVPESYVDDDNGITYNVTLVGINFLSGCNTLRSITFPRTFTGFNDYALSATIFHQLSTLEEVIFAEGCQMGEIYENTFYRCQNLRRVVLPEGLKTIGSNAFMYCSSLTEITLGPNMTNIGTYAFGYCSNLSSITITGKNIVRAAPSAFAYLPSSKTLTVPYGMKDVYMGLPEWSGFTIMEAGPLPGDLAVEESFNFNSTGGQIANWVETYRTESDQQSYTRILLKGSSYYVPTGLNTTDWKMIRKWMGGGETAGTHSSGFYCHYLDMEGAIFVADATPFYTDAESSYSIAQRGVVPDMAFAECVNLDTLILPRNTSHIGRSVFYGTRSTLVVQVPWNTPVADLDDQCFGADDADVSGMTLIVPRGSLAAYQNAEHWNVFGTIIEAPMSSDEEQVTVSCSVPSVAVQAYMNGNTYIGTVDAETGQLTFIMNKTGNLQLRVPTGTHVFSKIYINNVDETANFTITKKNDFVYYQHSALTERSNFVYIQFEPVITLSLAANMGRADCRAHSPGSGNENYEQFLYGGIINMTIADDEEVRVQIFRNALSEDRKVVGTLSHVYLNGVDILTQIPSYPVDDYDKIYVYNLTEADGRHPQFVLIYDPIAGDDGMLTAALVPSKGWFLGFDDGVNSNFGTESRIVEFAKGSNLVISPYNQGTCCYDVHVYVNGVENVDGIVVLEDGQKELHLENVTENLLIEVKYEYKQLAVGVCSSDGGTLKANYTSMNDSEMNYVTPNDGGGQLVTEIKPGTDMTFTFTPQQGYELGLVFCNDQRYIGEGPDWDVQLQADGTYQFVLPADQILSEKTTVTAIYKKIGINVNYDLNNDGKIDVGDVTKLVNEVLKQ